MALSRIGSQTAGAFTLGPEPQGASGRPDQSLLQVLFQPDFPGLLAQLGGKAKPHAGDAFPGAADGAPGGRPVLKSQDSANLGSHWIDLADGSAADAPVAAPDVPALRAVVAGSTTMVTPLGNFADLVASLQCLTTAMAASGSSAGTSLDRRRVGTAAGSATVGSDIAAPDLDTASQPPRARATDEPISNHDLFQDRRSPAGMDATVATALAPFKQKSVIDSSEALKLDVIVTRVETHVPPVGTGLTMAAAGVRSSPGAANGPNAPEHRQADSASAWPTGPAAGEPSATSKEPAFVLGRPETDQTEKIQASSLLAPSLQASSLQGIGRLATPDRMPDPGRRLAGQTWGQIPTPSARDDTAAPIVVPTARSVALSTNNTTTSADLAANEQSDDAVTASTGFGEAAAGASASSAMHQVAHAIVSRLPVDAHAADAAKSVGSAAVRGAVDGSLKVLHVQLQPDDLGTITVRLSMRGGALDVQMTADRSDVADRLAKDCDALAQVLRASSDLAEGLTVQIGSIASMSAPVTSTAMAAVTSSQPSLAGQHTGQSFAQDRSSGRPPDRPAEARPLHSRAADIDAHGRKPGVMDGMYL